MKCREIEGHLSAYLAEETAPDLRRSIKTHLRGCKKCRARLEILKAEKGVRQKEKQVAAPVAETIPPPKERPPLSPIKETLSGWRRPVEVSVMILLIGGAFYFYQREASELKANSTVENATPPAAETSAPPSAPVETGNAASTEGPPPAPPAQAAPAPPAARLPMKIHKATTQSASKEARRQATLAQPTAIKLLLISRNIKEAAHTVAAQAVASRGKVLSKKGDEMEAKVVLLIPAERYETFSQSLQSLGLVKDVSKKQLPSEGSLKIEVVIE